MVLRLSWLLLWSLQSTPELSAFTTSGGWTFQRPSSLAFTTASTLVERPLSSSSSSSSSSSLSTFSTSLFAKKSKANSKFLEALETLEGAVAVDEPLSLKEQQELEKQQKREAKKQQQSTTATTTNAPTAAGGGKAKDAKAAALAALEMLAAEDDSSDSTTLSKKEQLALLKQKQNGMNGSSSSSSVSGSSAAKEVNGVDEHDDVPVVAKELSKKELALQRALALEEQDNAASSAAASTASDDQGTTKLSKKELKAIQKQEEKLAAKAAEKAAKKASRAAEMAASEKGDSTNGVEMDAESEDRDDDDDDDEDDYEGASLNGEDSESLWSEDTIDYEKEDSARRANRVTLEDKIRKERPPPRIRVMESSQPGYTSLRLENVGITFRDQAVLKDVTWGVQTGDRIGLVGANGAGKTTQLRIMANEMEPTTGDVVKSSKDLRVAMLRQEFVDELIPDQTLKEEFMTVFAEENKILTDLREAERALEGMTGDEADAEEMQAILDRMQELQNKAEDKGVYALESQVKKVMDLMGFQDEEGDDLVASFSGGWKMRIGLGKVLLKDPNVLLLGEYSSLMHFGTKCCPGGVGSTIRHAASDILRVLFCFPIFPTLPFSIPDLRQMNLPTTWI
jgi:ABC-type Mn2+/Zn2+ transport system ATPase subunit